MLGLVSIVCHTNTFVVFSEFLIFIHPLKMYSNIVIDIILCEAAAVGMLVACSQDLVDSRTFSYNESVVY